MAMNGYSSPCGHQQRSNLPYYQDASGWFRCPAPGCREGYQESHHLEGHIHQGHDSSPKMHSQFPDPPMPPSHDRIQEPNPHNSSFYILATSRDQAFLENTHSQQNQPSNTDHFSVPGTSNHSTAQPSSRSPALSQRPARLTQDEPTLDEDWLAQSAGEWPPQTESYLKTLMISYGLFADPKTDPQNEQKLHAIFEKFYTAVEFQTWKPKKDDKNLRMLFRMKIDRSRAAMLGDGEVLQTSEGLKLWARPPNKNLFLDVQAKRLQESPPPTTPTPILPTAQWCDAIEIWKGLDGDMQMNFLKKQLQSVKNTKQVIFCLEEWCAQMRRKEKVETEKVPLVRKMSAPGITPEPTPSSSPRPEPKPTDLRTAMNDRIQELKLKRQLEKDELARQDRERELKRLKVDPE